MPLPRMARRRFLQASAALAGGAAMPGAAFAEGAKDYGGPNVVIIRFGGGARRRESIAPGNTYSPFVRDVLAPRGTLFNQMLIGDAAETGHGQGTLNLLTGKYDQYEDVDQQLLGERFEAKAPTLFEYLRRAFDVPEHQTLIVNGEDRTQEEFYTFSNHHLFGVNYRSNVLSLYRFKTYLLRRQIAEQAGDWSEAMLTQKQAELAEMEALDYRQSSGHQAEPIEGFWSRWRKHYGETGLVNPRGDRLLTELACRAITELRPRLMMINYNDCDYVHWGNLAHYTRALSIMDAGIERVVRTIENDEAYRGNTLVVVAPDCGRDDSPFAAVPCQHHFNSRSSREVFALFVGPGIDRGRTVDRATEQVQVAPTVAAAMGVPAPFAEGAVLEEAFA